MILGPNDPRAMKRNDPRLWKPKGKTLDEQVSDIADRIFADMTQDELVEMQKALESRPPTTK